MDREYNSHCFKSLSGAIPGSSCTIENIGQINSGYINPRMREITSQTYFRYYKLHIHRLCKKPVCENGLCRLQVDDAEKKLGKVKPLRSEHTSDELMTEWEKGDCDTCFCIFSAKEDPDNMLWIDLVSNPEQYTGYDGGDIWRVVYKGLQSQPPIIHQTVSGLHSSINMHLCYKYVSKNDNNNNNNTNNDNIRAESIVGPNVEEFLRRFHPEYTGNLGPSWLRNLYFTYVVLLSAVRKGDVYWKDMDISKDTKRLVLDLVHVTQNNIDLCDAHITKESSEQLESTALVYLTNLSGVFDHISCERCRLWGKVQIVGTRTAYKILFSAARDKTLNGLSLTRMEIVSLFNTLGRLSESLRMLDSFKALTSGKDA